jgi:hypothetical protein
MLDEVPPLQGNSSPSYLARWSRKLRNINLRSRSTRIVLLVLALLLAWYILAFETQQDAIRAAVFRSEIKPYSPANDTYYLSIEGDRDPSAWLLAQFKESNPPVLPLSQIPSKKTPSGLIPSRTRGGLPGAILSINSIGLVLPFLAIVDVEWYMAPLSGASYSEVLLWTGNGWWVCMRELYLMS